MAFWKEIFAGRKGPGLQALAKRLSTGIMPLMGIAVAKTSAEKKRFPSHQAFVSSLLSGMACSAAVYDVHLHPYPHVSPQAAMRGDWVKIGADFNAAMTRLREEAETEK